MQAVLGHQYGGGHEIKQAFFNFIHHKILPKAAATGNESIDIYQLA